MEFFSHPTNSANQIDFPVDWDWMSPLCPWDSSILFVTYYKLPTVI